eukprot:1832921-Alexandrium_andersonii.AAC.1
MSASLVGSEMCIRDSGRSISERPESEGALHTHGLLPSQTSQRARDGCGSVSYTHLTLPTICSV